MYHTLPGHTLSAPLVQELVLPLVFNLDGEYDSNPGPTPPDIHLPTGNPVLMLNGILIMINGVVPALAPPP